jgi:glycosyltransferase involved in cell wall biosynthesis
MDPFLRPCGQDLADEDREPLGLEYSLWRRSANAMNLLELENGVRPWVASAWTRSTYPDEYHASLSVHPEPVDHRRLRRAGPPHRTIAGRTLEPPTRLVTFAAGSADRLRGVDHFLKLAERLLAARSDVVCALAGDPMVVRGLDIRDYGQSTLERLLATSPIAHHDRLWCLGRLDPETRRALLHRTNLYVAPGRLAEPTRILGEALAAGCVALAWDLEPLREWITPNVNGLLVPAYDLTALFDLAQAVLDHPADYAHLAQTAAESIVTQRDPGTFVDSLIEPIWAQAPTNPRSRTAV